MNGSLRNRASSLGIWAVVFGILASAEIALHQVQTDRDDQLNGIKYVVDSLINVHVVEPSVLEAITLTSPEYVAGYYSEHDYKFIWSSEEITQPAVHIYELVARLERCYLEGLNPADYHAAEITKLMERRSNRKSGASQDKDAAMLDILLTDAYISYAQHHYAGRVSSKRFNASRNEHLKEISPMDSLNNIGKGRRMNDILESFVCPYPGYKQLQNTLLEYYDMEDPAEQITKYIRIISLNMERWRWLQRDIPDRYLMANIADFSLKTVIRSVDTLSMKIIAGKLEQPTPVFQAKLNYLILNPWWEVPHSIAIREMLPEIKRDVSYLAKHHLKIYRAGVELNPKGIKWDTITARNFTFRIRQTPGKWNALGLVKFIFQNPYDIYFHDTPQRELFSSEIRTFSHGCIRVEKPLELAALLLNKEEAWITKRIDTKQGEVLTVPFFTMVFVCYWTAWNDRYGEIHFARDVYGYDDELIRLLGVPFETGRERLLVSRESEGPASRN